MLRAQQLGMITFYLVRHAAGSFKSADHPSEGISYFRQICYVVGESRDRLCSCFVMEVRQELSPTRVTETERRRHKG